MKTKKASFTLLEIMVCLLLLALVGSIVGVQGARLITNHRFRSSTHRFAQDLMHLRILSMTYNCDITCLIEQDPKGHYTVTWKPDAPIAGLIPTYTLTGVQQILLDKKPLAKFECFLLASGLLSSQGILSFVPSLEENTLYLDLLYPPKLESSPPKKHPLSPPPYPIKKKEHLSAGY